MQYVLLIPEKPLFGTIWNSYSVSKLQNKLFIQKLERSILGLYATVTIGKKIRKFLSVNFSLNLETSFQANYGSFWLKKNQKETYTFFFQKTEFHLFLSQMTTLFRAENNKKKYCEQFQSKILGEKTNRQMYGGSFIGPSVGESKNQSEPA